MLHSTGRVLPGNQLKYYHAPALALRLLSIIRKQIITTFTDQLTMSSSTRSSQIFHRSLRKTYPIATSGKGVYLYSSDGTRILDGSSGAAVSCLGHGHEAVIQAIIDQAQRLAFAHTSFFSNDPAEELAQLLIERSDQAFSRVLYLSSGSFGRLYWHLSSTNFHWQAPRQWNRPSSYLDNTISPVTSRLE